MAECAAILLIGFYAVGSARAGPAHGEDVSAQHALIGDPHGGAVQGYVGIERCALGL
ncbi:hypothetical protein D3C77_733790 [compost metagenome]